MLGDGELDFVDDDGIATPVINDFGLGYCQTAARIDLQDDRVIALIYPSAKASATLRQQSIRRIDVKTMFLKARFDLIASDNPFHESFLAAWKSFEKT
jgi:hypothetical protein